MRWKRILKPITKEPKKIKFGVYDIESNKWIRHMATGFYDGSFYAEFYDHTDFLDYVFSEENEVLNIFAHFGGGFDFNFTMDAVMEHPDIELVQDGFIERGSKLLKMAIKKGDKTINFWDSSAILQFSLKKITETFDVKTKKGNFDFDRMGDAETIEDLDPKTRKDLLDYLMDDNLALYQSLEKFWAQEIFEKSGPAFTIAGQAQKVFRTYMKKEMRDLPRQVDEFVRSGYLGGRTEIFKPLCEGEDLNAYDVRSLYPFICMTEEMPGNFKNVTRVFDELSMGWWKCDVFCPDMYMPFLGVLHEGKLIFPTGRFSGVYSTKEINYARSLGYDIKTGKGMVFENSGKIFEEYMRDMYNIRLKYPSGHVMNTIAKLLMNSLYGKFGINRENKSEFLIDKGESGIKFHSEIITGKNEKVRFGTKPKFLNCHSHVGISAQVTAQAKIHMHKLMSMVEGDVYYTDTDSIYTTKILPTGKMLGQLQLESVDKDGNSTPIRDACFLLPKTYIVDGKIKMKGFEHKKIQHFTMDDFKLALTGELAHLKISIPEKFMKYKSALKSGKMLNMHKATTKEIRSLYNKRTIVKTDEGFDSIPLCLGG